MPVTSVVRRSTLGWNAQQKRLSRSASRKRCSCDMREVAAWLMVSSKSTAVPFTPVFARYMAQSALRRSAS